MRDHPFVASSIVLASGGPNADDGLLIAVGTGHWILLEGVEKADLAKDAFALVVV